MDNLSFKEVIKQYFDVELPIKGGGNGRTIESAIIIEKQFPNNDYTSVEFYILKLLGIGRNLEWRTIQQTLMHFESKKIDEIKIEIKRKKENEVETSIESYYFDITECLHK